MNPDIVKILVVGDTHIRGTVPRYRKKDFLKTQFQKLKYVFQNIAQKHQVDAIIHTGDFFDSPYASLKLINQTAEILKGMGSTPLYAVYGQHDIRFHSMTTIESAPLTTLLYACNGFHLDGKVIELTDNITLSGVSWGMPIETKDVDIFAIHRLISNEQTMFEVISAKDLCKMLPNTRLILTGDNHKTFAFYKERTGQLVLNPGSMMRQNKDQMEHKPCVFIVEIEKHGPTGKTIIVNTKKEYLPVEPSEEVFDLDAIMEDEKKSDSTGKNNAEIMLFLRNLKNKVKNNQQFCELLDDAAKRTKDIELQQAVHEMIDAIKRK